jgi:hypothetical protein
MAIQATAKALAYDPIRQLFIAAGNSAKRDRRSEVRFSFFRPVSIRLHDGPCVSAFSRDISSSAIGLLHDRPLPIGEVELSIASATGTVRVLAHITRCEFCGGDWHISAAEFAGSPIAED